MAESFGEVFGMGSLAGYLGICHDIGKYSAKAQERLRGKAEKVDHATFGGQIAEKNIGSVFANCVLGHHSGLLDGGTSADRGGEATVCGRLKKKVDDASAFAAEIVLPIPEQPPLRPLGNGGFSYAFCARMLFSCVVDADFIDTERFMSEGKVVRGRYDSIAILQEKLNAYLQGFDTPTSDINRKRSEILEKAVSAAQGDKGLYSLTVPTGGGKTLSSLAFALNHAKKHGLRRIIYVVPYTSIIEQNAAVFASILGEDNVLEHHSNVVYENPEDGGNQHYLATENWDCPVVVTTNVQFFESLFGNRTSTCRKLHNIAGSVVVFDEAQMLPLPYLKPCIQAIAELAHNYGCTALLCTATQPALSPLFPPELSVQEICEEPGALQQYFKRVSFADIGRITDIELAEQLRSRHQALCIVNTRKQAHRLFGLLEGEGNYHLSTLQYPLHRGKKLDEVRQRLKAGLPCRVVATSLIEAGVDVDFPTVYRAKAGLDSVIQAAGRCNREGKRDRRESSTFLFEPDEAYAIPNSMEQNLAAFRHVQREFSAIDSLEAIEEYFNYLYFVKGEALDQKRIVQRLEEAMKDWSFPFQTIAKEFKLIEQETKTVVIPDCEACKQLVDRLRRGERNRDLMRQIGRYSINVYPKHFEELYGNGVIELLDETQAVLADVGTYSAHTGLALDVQTGKEIFA